MKHAKAKSMGWNNTLTLKVALTRGSPVFCSWIFASEDGKIWGSCAENDGLYILAAAQKTNGGGCRISRSGLKVLSKFSNKLKFFSTMSLFQTNQKCRDDFCVTPSRGETNSQALFHPWPPSTVSSPSPREPGKWRAYFYGNSNRHNSSVAVESFSLDVHPVPFQRPTSVNIYA